MQGHGIAQGARPSAQSTIPPKRSHAMKNLPDGRKPEGCCLWRSWPPSFIAQLENLVPGRSYEVGLQSVALESGLAEPEAAAVLTFGGRPTETRFDNGLHCRLFPVGQLSHFFIKTVWYLYGCFHMYNYIIWEYVKSVTRLAHLTFEVV